jgi:hypothetical protein
MFVDSVPSGLMFQLQAAGNGDTLAMHTMARAFMPFPTLTLLTRIIFQPIRQIPPVQMN